MGDTNNGTTVMSEVQALVRTWEDEHSQNTYDPIPTLTR